jgi:hypothetical protein
MIIIIDDDDDDDDHHPIILVGMNFVGCALQKRNSSLEP